MAYGDSANWDGTASASMATQTYTFRVSWERNANVKYLECPLRVNSGDEAEDVARRLATSWNDTNPQGNQAIFDSRRPVSRRVWFEGEPRKFYIYLQGGTFDPVNDWIKYGANPKQVDGLSVFVA